jgi:hypothetical protein
VFVLRRQHEHGYIVQMPNAISAVAPASRSALQVVSRVLLAAALASEEKRSRCFALPPLLLLLLLFFIFPPGKVVAGTWIIETHMHRGGVEVRRVNDVTTCHKRNSLQRCGVLHCW